MTHLASRQNLNFGTAAPRDGESMHSGFVKVEADLQYLFEMADTVGRRVDTVADLTTLDKPVDGELVMTAGWRVLGDEGANLYRYDATSIATCDGGSVVDGIGGNNAAADTSEAYAGTGTGRFFAVHTKRMNSKQWGCFGDNATDDAWRLTAWGNHTGATELDLGSLSYVIGGTGWFLQVSDKVLVGSGAILRASVVSTQNNSQSQATVIRVTGDNITIRGVEVDAGGFPNTAITVEGNGFVLEDCKAHDTDISSGGGVQIFGSSDFTVDGCEFYNNNDAGMYCGSLVPATHVSRGWVKNCYFHDNGDATGLPALNFGGADLHIVNNKFINNTGTGIASVTFGSGDIERVTISGNKFNGNDTGISLLEFSGDMKEIHITDNQIIDSATIGISVASADGIYISGNTVVSNFGVSGPLNGDGIRLQQVTNSTVSGNFIRAGDIGFGVQVDGHGNGISIAGNHIYNGNVGIDLDINHGSTASDGFLVNGNSVSSTQSGSTGISLVNNGVANITNVTISNNYLDAANSLVAVETGAGGDVGWSLFGNSIGTTFLPSFSIVNGDLERNDGNAWNKSVFWDTAVPTTGLHAIGDRVWNENPASNEISHWLCTVAGTPGTWIAFGGGVLSGAGSPEGAVTATVGVLFRRTDGGAGATLYVKESGAGNTGWAAK